MPLFIYEAKETFPSSVTLTTANITYSRLREVASLAAWVVRQAEAGRSVEARRGTEVELLSHPVIERLRASQKTPVVPHITLSGAEVERLAHILDRGFSPTPALRAVLQRLANPKRRPPKLRWKKTA